MGGITLQSRQSLSKRVQFFGGANGRGTRRVRFGFVPYPEDAVRYWAMAEAGARKESADAIYKAKNAVDWNGLYELDYPRALQLDTAINGSPIWAPAGGPPVSAPVNPPPTPPAQTYTEPPVVNPPPATVPPPPPAPPVVTPGVTDADYQAMVVANQIEAARQQALMTAHDAQMRADAAQAAADLQSAAAQDALARANQNSTPPKSNAVPWLIAAGLALLALKG